MLRQKGQVYYFPLRHSDGWSKWLSEVGEFHTFFEYVLYFVPFCTMQPFLPSVPIFGGEKMEERERTQRQGEKCHLLVSECFSTALIHLCQQHVSTFLFFLHCCTKTRPKSTDSPMQSSCKSNINHNTKRIFIILMKKQQVKFVLVYCESMNDSFLLNLVIPPG